MGAVGYTRGQRLLTWIGVLNGAVLSPRRWWGLLPRLPLGQQVVVVGAVVGAVAGASVFVFEGLARLVFRTAFQGAWSAGIPRPVLFLFFPVLGGLLAGWILHRLCPEARGHGVMEVITALREKKGHIPGRVAWGKTLASAATIGLGGSAGREGPVVHIGAAVGSWMGQRLGVPAGDLRMLAAAGAVAGLSAAFGTPLAGVFFTMEVIMRDFANEAFPAVVVAAVTAAALARVLMPTDHFVFPVHEGLSGAGAWVGVVALAMTAGLMGGLFRHLLSSVEARVEKANLSPVFKPALGGLGVGALACFWPEVLGSGGEMIRQTMSGTPPSALRSAVLAPVKMAATVCTLGFGGSGGSLMPTLYVGGQLGRAWTGLWRWTGNDLPGPHAFPLVGMAAVFAAMFHAPVTAMVLALEMTQNYALLPLVMVGCVVATLSAASLRSRAVPDGHVADVSPGR